MQKREKLQSIEVNIRVFFLFYVHPNIENIENIAKKPEADAFHKLLCIKTAFKKMSEFMYKEQ